jgi:ferredoxin-NADP reductase
MNKITTVKVLKVRHLTDSTFVLRAERKGFEFIPGQCVNLGLPKEAINREYSTYSGKDEKYLEFLVKTIEDGALSPKLAKLKPGDEITIDGAYGLFTIPHPEDTKNKYLFIGTGTGIAPFHSFALSYPKLDYVILHGVSYKSEQYDSKDYPKKRYISCVSRGDADRSPIKSGMTSGVFAGRVTEYLREHPVDPKTICYLCGNSEMINEVYDILREQRVGGTNIITEVFF